MPKRENFSSRFYTKWSHLGWWLGDWSKKSAFDTLLDGIGFLTECWVFSKIFFVWVRPKLEVVGCCSEAQIYSYSVFFVKKKLFGSFISTAHAPSELDAITHERLFNQHCLRTLAKSQLSKKVTFRPSFRQCCRNWPQDPQIPVI